VDIATLFASRPLSSVKNPLVDVIVTSQKLRPSTMAFISNFISDAKANIESIQRIDSDPTSLCLTISNSSVAALSASLTAATFEDGATVVVKAHG